MSEYAVITVRNLNKKIAVRKGTDLLTALVKGNILIPSSCGGRGVCGRCKVKILKGEYEAEPTGKISEKEKKENIHLACRTIVKGNIEI
ncbi:MAG: oxidoreductase, partial [Thermoplasmata archaeon]